MDSGKDKEPMAGSIKHFSEQSKAEAYQRIEQILERAEPHIGYPCPRGTVHRAWFLYEAHWSQIGARVSEMNDAGWTVTSVDLPKSQWVNAIKTAYRLDSKPLKPGEDWYTIQTGQPRPSGHPWKKPFSAKRMAQDDCFVLTPPEPRR
jgi:hypothetical protein